MSDATLFVCPDPSIAIISDGAGHEFAACASGQGSVQHVVVVEPFDPATLNSSELSGAFGAGFIVMATGLVIVWSAKQIMRAIRGALT